jgi:hypothetical protein
MRIPEREISTIIREISQIIGMIYRNDDEKIGDIP